MKQGCTYRQEKGRDWTKKGGYNWRGKRRCAEEKEIFLLKCQERNTGMGSRKK